MKNFEEFVKKYNENNKYLPEIDANIYSKQDLVCEIIKVSEQIAIDMLKEYHEWLNKKD